jgi:hypothetical protein
MGIPTSNRLTRTLIVIQWKVRSFSEPKKKTPLATLKTKRISNAFDANPDCGISPCAVSAESIKAAVAQFPRDRKEKQKQEVTIQSRIRCGPGGSLEKDTRWHDRKSIVDPWAVLLAYQPGLDMNALPLGAVGALLKRHGG